MNQNEFMREQQAAVERMREMNSRAQINSNTTHKMPPVPSFVRVNQNNRTQTQEEQKNYNTPKAEAVQNKMPQNNMPPLNQSNSILGGLNIPFLDSLLKDGDSTLIIGLLLILLSEKSDKMLLFALVYILL